MDLPFTEPFKIKMVENIYRSTRADREKWNIDTLKLEEILKNNPSDKISCIIITVTNNT